MAVRVHFLAGLMGLIATATPAAEIVALREEVKPGDRYTVSTRVKLSGQLAVPVDDGKSSKTVEMRGESSIDYEELVLPAVDQQLFRSVRNYRQIEVTRKTGDLPQDQSLRAKVHRIVFMKSAKGKTAFSPDGALTFGEIDLLRTDIITPMLAGLLPQKEVRVGDRWAIGIEAIRELTDLDRVQKGELTGQLEQVTTIGNRPVAHFKFGGLLEGVNEDGPNRQRIDGTGYFDLQDRLLIYVSLNGDHELLDGEGKVAGKIQGRYVMTRGRQGSAGEPVRDPRLEPNESNTMLLYENPELGIHFLHPRHWKVAAVRGRQITVEDQRGNGLLVTVETLAKLGTIEQYRDEAIGVLNRRQAKVLRNDPLERLTTQPGILDRASFLVQVDQETCRMEYYSFRNRLGGATVAARLVPQEVTASRREVEAIARSIEMVQELETSPRTADK